MKITFLLLIFFAVATAENANFNYCKKYGIETLYEKRMYIANLYDTCTLYEKSCKGVQYIIDKLRNAPYSEWQNNKEEFWHLFFNLAHVNGRAEVVKINGVLPNDTILTEIYAKALAYENSQKVQQDAFRILTEYTPYILLKRYSGLIEDALCASGLSKKQKNFLYSYCNPEQPLRNELLADSTLPVSARIRIGDKSAESRLFDKYYTVTDFDEKERIVAQIADAGTEKCLHFLIKQFNKPIYKYGRDSCIIKSIGIAVIQGFQRHLPDDPNFNKKFNNFRSTNYIEEKKFSEFPFFAQYFHDVITSFRAHYGIVPDDTTFIPEMKGDIGCGTPIIPQK